MPLLRRRRPWRAWLRAVSAGVVAVAVAPAVVGCGAVEVAQDPDDASVDPVGVDGDADGDADGDDVVAGLPGADASAPAPGVLEPLPPVCPAARPAFVTVVPGAAPVVVVATHAGDDHPAVCRDGDTDLHSVGVRACTPELDVVCASGPCRAGGVDRFSREIAFALVDALADCLGRRPSLVVAETSRIHVDMNRDAFDPGGPRCAYDDPAALPLWQEFHDAVAGLVVEADRVALDDGTRGLLLDVHTHGSLAAAPSPAVLLGAGLPFGTTLPRRRSEDPALAVVFGDDGLRARVRDALRPRLPDVEVWPAAVDGAHDGLFNGRTVVHRYSLGLVDGVPAIDALQLEASDGVRDAPVDVARAWATGLCATLLARGS